MFKEWNAVRHSLTSIYNKALYVWEFKDLMAALYGLKPFAS